MHPLKIIQIDDSLACIIPDEIRANLALKAGDYLLLKETPHGLLLQPCETEFAEQVEAGREIMRERAEVFRELAKY